MQTVVPFRWLLFSIPFVAVSTVCLRALMGLKIMKYEIWVRSLLEPLSFLFFILVFYFLGWQLQGVIFSHLFAMILGSIAAVFLLSRHNLLPKTFKVKKAFTKEANRYLIPLSVYDVVSFLFIKKDVFIISFFLDPLSVGIFVVANEIALSANKIRQAFEPIFAPVAAELHHTKEHVRLKQNYRVAFRWSLALYLVFIASMWFLTKPILFLFGPTFVSASQTVFLLVLGYSIHGIFGAAESSLIMSGRSLVNLIDTLGLIILNVGLNIFLIPKYGIIGAGVGTCCSVVLIDLIRVVQVYILFKKHPFEWSTLKLLFSIAIAFGSVLFLQTEFPFLTKLWFLNVPLLIVFFAALLYFFRLEHEDQYLLRSLCSKVRSML